MSRDDVRKTYNEVGRYIMEAMYSDDYLSIGGPASTDALADAASLQAGERVLDVGSGLGGPALHLGATRGVDVTGLDLVETAVADANARAAERDLTESVRFREGDATDMPFDTGAFDVVWGQDAWCHVPGKDRLIAEGARVLSPTGRFAFTDWIQLSGMGPSEQAETLKAISSPDLATTDDYRDWLARVGFELGQVADISETFTRQYRDVVAKLEAMADDLEGRFGRKVRDIVMARNHRILDAFESGGMGGGLFIAGRV